MSGDDKEPQGPFNPFIRFKNHVNSRIGTGVSVLTGASEDGDKPAGDAQNDGSVQTAAGSSSSCSARNQSPGGPKRQSPIAGYWDDWCHVDPYSPHNLRHLPQPTPKDLPPTADPADFGYPEAFEDLMSASNPFRGNLMDLGMRAGLKRTATGAPVKPETPSAWVRRLYGEGLLPHPFIWEQPKLAGRVPRHWEAHVRGPLGTQQTPEHDHDNTSDIAKEFLDTIRRIDNIVGESFSKMEELMGKDMADLMRNAQKFAENAMKVFTENRSGDHVSGSSDDKPQSDVKSASVNEEDQPATEQDLYEFIRRASVSADNFINDFLSSGTGQAPPPPERASRDNPPVSETVEHDSSGGKTIRTSSEHVDMFGFIHSRTEVRRVNAKGETVDYDTRYSVRSGPRDDRLPLQDYRPRSDAPVSVLMTPEQYRAFLSESSDEQLRAFKSATADADESGLGPENLKLKNQQMQLIQQELQRRDRFKAPPNLDSLQDYQRQLILLEAVNKRRLLWEPREAESQSASSGKTAPADEAHNSQVYRAALERMCEQSREKQRRATEETAPDSWERERRNHTDHVWLLNEQIKLRKAISGEYAAPGRIERDYLDLFASSADQNKPKSAVTSQAAQQRQDHQDQSRLLGEQNQRRLVRVEDEAEASPPPKKPEGSTNSERSGWFWR